MRSRQLGSCYRACLAHGNTSAPLTGLSMLTVAHRRVILCARVWENPLTGEVVDASSRTLASAASPTAAAAAGKGGNTAGGVPAGAVAALPAGIRKAANLAELHADGSVTLEDGTRIADVDCVMYCTGGRGERRWLVLCSICLPGVQVPSSVAIICSQCFPGTLLCPTGYHYSFPFLDEFVTVEDNRVGPLYQHIFPPAAAPTLSFVGLPWKVSRVAGTLSGSCRKQPALQQDGAVGTAGDLVAAGLGLIGPHQAHHHPASPAPLPLPRAAGSALPPV